jgi:hypothetical protein
VGTPPSAQPTIKSPSKRNALSNDLDAAKAALSEAERAASEATVPVILDEAERVATYLVAACREVLAGLSSVLLAKPWISGREGPRPVRLSRKLLDALSAQEPQYPPSMRSCGFCSFYDGRRLNFSRIAV